MNVAELLEQKYQRYRNLREVALSVYAPKIEEYENPDYEKICTLVVFWLSHPTPPVFC